MHSVLHDVPLHRLLPSLCALAGAVGGWSLAGSELAIGAAVLGYFVGKTVESFRYVVDAGD